MENALVEIEGQKVEVIDTGGDKFPVFLIHGNSSSAHYFNNLLCSDLANNYRFIAISLLGHGNSDAAVYPDVQYSIKEIGRFVLKLINMYSFVDYGIVGQSLGGHAVLEILHDFKGLRGLMLLSAPPINLSALDKAFLEDPSDGLLFKGDLNEEERKLLSFCFIEKQLGQSQRQLQLDIERTDPLFRDALGKSLAAGLMEDEIANYKSAKISIGIIGGTEDKFINNNWYDSFREKHLWREMPLLIRGSGHATLLDEPKQTISLLENYFKSVCEVQVERQI